MHLFPGLATSPILGFAAWLLAVLVLAWQSGCRPRAGQGVDRQKGCFFCLFYTHIGLFDAISLEIYDKFARSHRRI